MTNHTQDKTGCCEQCRDRHELTPYGLCCPCPCHTTTDIEKLVEEFRFIFVDAFTNSELPYELEDKLISHFRTTLTTHTEQKVREEAVSWYLKVKEMTKTIRENDFAKGIKIAKDLDDRMKELQTLTPNDK